ncbi:HypC/HybG/HupF family hydrogenase formation chaperone [Derxia lacustris]|uniref:HypC/HybG/HupF family hydrogenase formation chaperone n=1 Tax=Derxia lacustris TaxID=764842 RepID=UPI000A1723EE|nr:HypC/HybG/HupF family hydrogenase formation chaperone [Derxia lacustris]
MCLAIPARVISVDSEQAVVDLGGVRKRISIALVPDAVAGDYVIVHVGYAIGRIDPEEAERTLAIFAEGGLLDSAFEANRAGLADAEPADAAPAAGATTAPGARA